VAPMLTPYLWTRVTNAKAMSSGYALVKKKTPYREPEICPCSLRVVYACKSSIPAMSVIIEPAIAHITENNASHPFLSALCDDISMHWCQEKTDCFVIYVCGVLEHVVV